MLRPYCSTRMSTTEEKRVLNPFKITYPLFLEKWRKKTHKTMISYNNEILIGICIIRVLFHIDVPVNHPQTGEFSYKSPFLPLCVLFKDFCWQNGTTWHLWTITLCQLKAAACVALFKPLLYLNIKWRSSNYFTLIQAATYMIWRENLQIRVA